MSIQNKVDILALRRLSVLNESGEPVPFSKFWEDENVIIIFIRHFGCIACRAHVDQIWNKREGLKAKKCRIIFIGNGKPYLISKFKEIMKVPDADIFTDPSLKTFRACGLKRGLTYLINLKTVKRMKELKREGYSQGKQGLDTGSHIQMGGVVAFKDPGEVLYHFVSEHLGDFDKPDDWPDKVREDK